MHVENLLPKYDHELVLLLCIKNGILLVGIIHGRGRRCKIAFEVFEHLVGGLLRSSIHSVLYLYPACTAHYGRHPLGINFEAAD